MAKPNFSFHFNFSNFNSSDCRAYSRDSSFDMEPIQDVFTDNPRIAGDVILIPNLNLNAAIIPPGFTRSVPSGAVPNIGQPLFQLPSGTPVKRRVGSYRQSLPENAPKQQNISVYDMNKYLAIELQAGEPLSVLNLVENVFPDSVLPFPLTNKEGPNKHWIERLPMWNAKEELLTLPQAFTEPIVKTWMRKLVDQVIACLSPKTSIPRQWTSRFAHSNLLGADLLRKPDVALVPADANIVKMDNWKQLYSVAEVSSRVKPWSVTMRSTITTKSFIILSEQHSRRFVPMLGICSDMIYFVVTDREGQCMEKLDIHERGTLNASLVIRAIIGLMLAEWEAIGLDPNVKLYTSIKDLPNSKDLGDIATITIPYLDPYEPKDVDDPKVNDAEDVDNPKVNDAEDVDNPNVNDAEDVDNPNVNDAEDVDNHPNVHDTEDIQDPNGNDPEDTDSPNANPDAINIDADAAESAPTPTETVYRVTKTLDAVRGLVGRATRVWLAVDNEANGAEPVVIKDAWIHRDRATVETDILKHLNSLKVKGVPVLVSHTTVQVKDHTNSINDILKMRKDTTQWFRTGYSSKNARIHRRLVLRPVGRPLSAFSSLEELVGIFLDIIAAHKACCDAGVLHRDISFKNILLIPSKDSDKGARAEGLLIDFDYAATSGLPESRMKVGERTGTPPYMAISLLLNSNPDTIHHAEYDLESLFYVAIYCATALKGPNNRWRENEELYGTKSQPQSTPVMEWFEVEALKRSYGRMGREKLAHMVLFKTAVIGRMDAYFAPLFPGLLALKQALFPGDIAESHVLPPISHEKMANIFKGMLKQLPEGQKVRRSRGVKRLHADV